uniref:Wsv161 n=1 Tax=White spot syndrome virus TaxID=92652 RepID=A0A2U9G7D4_WSSV|nr:wsv161 [Shrimp white spot syndrome virus]
MKKHIFPPSKKRKRSDTESKALAVPAGKMMTVSRPLRGAITSGSILGVRSENAPQYDYVSYLADEAVVKEKAIQYRIRSLLANLLKANKTKAFPTSSSLLSSEQGKKKFGGKRTNTFVVTNVGAELVKALLANSCWAISHRKDIRSGEIQWQELSSKILKSLNDGNATEINNLMSSIVEDRIQRTVKERVYFEQLATVCNNLFGTRILPNKNFDKNFVSVASDNSNATVRGLSIPRYFRAINNNVWVKMSSTMDLLVGGGMRSKSEHSISMLEKCAAGVLARASARPVEKMIKSAVEETSQAFNLSTGVFVPKQQQQQRQQQQQQFPPFQPPPFPLPPPQAPFQVQQPTYQGYLNPYYQYNQYYNPYAPQQLQQQYPLYFLGNQFTAAASAAAAAAAAAAATPGEQPFPVQLISSPPPPPPIPNTAPSPPISRVRFDSRSTTPQPPPTPVLPKPTPLPPPSTARAEEENATDMSFTDIDSELGSIDFDLPPATPEER